MVLSHSQLYIPEVALAVAVVAPAAGSHAAAGAGVGEVEVVDENDVLDWHKKTKWRIPVVGRNSPFLIPPVLLP